MLFATVFSSPEFHADPYPFYQQWRQEGAVHRVNSLGGGWLLLGYADVQGALLAPQLSGQRSHLLSARLPREARNEVAQLDRLLGQWMTFFEPEHHLRVRRVLSAGFMRDVLAGLRPRIQAIADSLVDDLVDRSGSGDAVDFIAHFASPLPVQVIADLLGIDHSAQGDFLAWSDDIIAFVGPRPTVEVARRAQRAMIAMTEYFGTLVPQRRRCLGDDLVSRLIRAADSDDGLLSAEQLIAQCVMLLVAGHETTRNLLGNGLLALLRHPDQLGRLRAQPQMIPNALRELLRYDGPIRFITRPVVAPLSMHGYAIEPGQTVYCLIGAANRDPSRFYAPDVLDVARPTPTHLSFGGGVHMCLGASLAYLEGEVAFSTLLRRLDDICLFDHSPRWDTRVSIRALESLPIVTRTK